MNLIDHDADPSGGNEKFRFFENCKETIKAIAANDVPPTAKAKFSPSGISFARLRYYPSDPAFVQTRSVGMPRLI
jgi:hypothetical protein